MGVSLSVILALVFDPEGVAPSAQDVSPGKRENTIHHYDPEGVAHWIQLGRTIRLGLSGPYRTEKDAWQFSLTS